MRETTSHALVSILSSLSQGRRCNFEKLVTAAGSWLKHESDSVCVCVCLVNFLPGQNYPLILSHAEFGFSMEREVL